MSVTGARQAIEHKRWVNCWICEDVLGVAAKRAIVIAVTEDSVRANTATLLMARALA
jgi:hypothetical protein